MYQVRRIGLAIDAVAAYGRGVIRGIMNFCRVNPHWVIAVEPQWAFGTLPPLGEWDVDGLIVQTFSPDFEEQVIRRGLPAVNVSNFIDEPQRLPTIVPDDAATGTMAAEYLLSLGFRELGFCWPGATAYGRLRIHAFRERVESAAVRFHECNAAQQDVGQWLLNLPKPAGVLGSNDDWAHRALNAARRAGVKVPDQVAVMGIDDDELFNTLVTPSLSSIAMPAEQIGHEAATQLERLMNGESLAQQITLLPPLRVVARESTDVLSIPDQDVVQALRFIKDHAARPIQVNDVLDHVPLSRRSLERRFRKLVGRSISAEIRRAHLERAKQLLMQTDLAMPQVAAGSGFMTATRLGIVFQKEMKETPTQFRQRARSSAPAVRKS